MGMTPQEYVARQQAGGKPKPENLLDMPRPHAGSQGREQVRLRIDVADFEKNYIGHEAAIEENARANARAIWEAEDSEEGFRAFQAQIHALEVPAAEEDLDNLSAEEIAVKMQEAQARLDQQDQVDKKAWRAFQARPTSQFLRAHPECSESDQVQIELQLAEWRIPTEKASLEQLTSAYFEVVKHGLSRPIARRDRSA